MATLVLGAGPVTIDTIHSVGDSYGLAAKSTGVATLGFDDRVPAGDSSLTQLIVLEDAASKGSAIMKEAYRAIKPGGSVVVHAREGVEGARRGLLRQGFRKVKGEGGSIARGERPPYERGAAVPLPVGVSEATLGQDDLMDEDELLGEGELRPPEGKKSESACKPERKRKACKNCTCGRAEGKVTIDDEGKVDDAGLPKSACGSCYLGDAFRCDGCPYLGMPAFKPSARGTATVVGQDDV